MAKTPQTDDGPTDEEPSITGKGRRTPTRKEREEARKRPLVPNDRRTAHKEQRARVQAQRERVRAGMANGEERYLPARDKGPQRRYVRDFVDARWNVGELMLPLLAAVILTYFFPLVAEIALLAVWAFILLVVLDCVVLGFQLKRRLTAKFGASRLEKGYRWYAAMRAVQLRVLRLPKPQARRGQYPS